MRVLSGAGLAVLFSVLGIIRAAWADDVVRYDGHRVVRVDVHDEAGLDQLLKLTDDVWSHEIGIGELDVRVDPTQFAALGASGLPYRVLIDDVQRRIDEQMAGAGLRGAGPFEDYMRYEDVNAYMESLVALRPDLAQTFALGTSLQNRAMRAIRITGPGPTPKPGVLFHGGQHAREWITVPTALYVADHLVRNYDTDAYVRELVDRCEFYIMPIMNPDGYVYTWDNTRLWRKNRRNNGDGTFGVDLNRNWGHQWGGEGASAQTNSETYRGTGPFSEPETQAVRDFVTSHPNLVAYNDLHSYSQLILWPWGYTATLPPDQAEFSYLGFGMESIIESVHATDYISGPIYTTIYPASGGSADWVYGARGIIGYSFELRDTGNDGFLLPPDQIIPNCEEVLPALLWYADEISAPLRISFPDGTPSLAPPQQPATFDVRIVDNVELLDPTTARVHVRIGSSGPFTSLPLAPLGGELYQATLPGRNCGPASEFYVTAASTLGHEVVRPADAPDSVFSLSVGEIIEQFRDNFESNNGWTVTNDPSLTSGAWERVNPVGTVSAGEQAQPEDDNPAGAGTLCYITQNGSPGGGAGAADVDGGPTVLTSPALEVSAMADPRLSYYMWYFTSGTDLLLVEISADGGPWQPLETVADLRSWVRVEFRLADVAPGAATIRVRFSATDNPNNSVVEAGVDDVVITDFECQSTATPGDMNCDGVVSVSDIAGFVLALTDPAGYSAQYPSCDINNADVSQDGQISVSDIGPFVALLTGG